MQDMRLSSEIENEDEVAGLDLRRLWQVIAKHKWSIVGLTLLITLVTGLFVYRQAPIYRATARLQIERNPVQFAPVQDPYAAYTDHWLYYQTQYGLIKRRTIGERVVEALGLGQEPTTQTPARSGFSWKSLLPNDWFPEPPQPTAEERISSAVSWVVGGIQVEPVRNSQLVDVSFESGNPVQAAQLANAVVDAYIRDNLDGRLQMTQSATDYLIQRMVELKDRLDKSEAAVQVFRDQDQLLGSSGADSVAGQELTMATNKLSAASKALVDAEGLAEQIRQVRADSNRSLVGLPAIFAKPVVQPLNEAWLAAKRNVEELALRYGPKHPRMMAAHSELDSAQAALDRQVAIAADEILRQYQAALTHHQAAQKELVTVRSRLRGVDRKKFELDALEREATKNRAIYEKFQIQLKETDAAGVVERANARVVERAIVGGRPVKPDKRRALSIALFLGLMASIGLAFLLEHLDNTLKGAEDVERRLSLPVLGLLPKLKEAKESDLAPLRFFAENRNSVFSECIRTIRTGVLLSSLDDKHKILLVTSSVPGEGKTTLSVNLARAIAEMKQVLLIDADMRRPTVARALGENSGAKGLSQFISNESPLKECVHRLVPGESLYVMPAGVVPPNPLEMLSSQRFAYALDQLAERFDHIIVDCAPTLAVSDAMVLSKLASAVIYVIKSDSTPVQAAQAGLKRLRRVGAHLIGCVVNQAQRRTGRYYGKYSGTYGDYYADYGYGSPEESKT